MSYTKIMPRGGTKYEWTTMNPVLGEREMAVEYPDSGIGTGLCRFKFGDGFKTYNELAYAFDGASASNLIGGSAFTGNTFQIRADSHENWLLANPILEENELVYDTTYNCFYIGDGASRFNQLTAAGRDTQRIYDFGDEDEDEIVSPIPATTVSTVSTASTSSSPAFAGSSTPKATLGDLMSMALGGKIDPQPIEGGTPLIIDPVVAPSSDEVTDNSEEVEDFGDESVTEETEKTEAASGMTVDEFLEKNADIAEIEEDETVEDQATVETEIDTVGTSDEEVADMSEAEKVAEPELDVAKDQEEELTINETTGEENATDIVEEQVDEPIIEEVPTEEKAPENSEEEENNPETEVIE